MDKGKQASRGRQKIPIAMIREKNKKHVTFSKRRKGLFKKASELCVLCGVDIAIVTFSEAGKAFCFGHPNADAVIRRYLHGTSSSSSSSPMADPFDYALMLHKFNEDYERVKQEIKIRTMMMMMTNAAGVGVGTEGDNINIDDYNGGDLNGNDGGFWWEQSVDGLELHELQQYLVSLEELRNNVVSKAQEMGSVNEDQIGFTRDHMDMDYYNNTVDCQRFDNHGGSGLLNHHDQYHHHHHLGGAIAMDAGLGAFGIPNLFPHHGYSFGSPSLVGRNEECEHE
ncbi:hypothetical protein Dimus_000429 [Dionaea muscipula]